MKPPQSLFVLLWALSAVAVAGTIGVEEDLSKPITKLAAPPDETGPWITDVERGNITPLSDRGATNVSGVEVWRRTAE